MLENIKSSVLKSKNISPFLVPSEHHKKEEEEEGKEEDKGEGEGASVPTDLCMVCVTRPRNASFIHGDTGHQVFLFWIHFQGWKIKKTDVLSREALKAVDEELGRETPRALHKENKEKFHSRNQKETVICPPTCTG